MTVVKSALGEILSGPRSQARTKVQSILTRTYLPQLKIIFTEIEK